MTAGGVLRGASWGYGAQIATVVAQLAYAAVTSRLVDASGFGSYAIALMLVGLLGILSSAGIPQTAARMIEVRPELVRSFVTYAWLFGLIASIVLLVSAPWWATLWADPDAVAPSLLLAVAVLFTAPANANQGLLRRQGKFRILAMTVVGSNLVGMAVGTVAVLVTRDATGLVVSPIISVFLQLVSAMIANGRAVWGFASIRGVGAELGYSARMLPLVLTDYLVVAVPRLATSRILSPTALGYWNRGDVLTSVPSQQVQSAIAQAVRPEFRHDIADSRRAFVAWTDLLILTAWLAIPASAVGAVVLPFLVPILFGPDWAPTAGIVSLLAIGAGLQLLGGVLGTAIEVLGRFRWLWMVVTPLLLLQLVGIWLLFEFRLLVIPIGIFVVTMLLRHAIQLVLCARNDYLDLRRLLLHYLAVAGISTVLAGVVLLGLELILTFGAPVAGGLVLGALVLAVIGVGWLLRAYLPPVAIARRYGLLRRSTQ